MERLKTMSRESGKGKFVKITALHNMVTDPNNIGHGSRLWSEKELSSIAGTITATGAEFNWNHHDEEMQGPDGKPVKDPEFKALQRQNVIFDAYVENEKIEGHNMWQRPAFV